MSKVIKLPMSTIVDGRTWLLCSYKHSYSDGKFCGHLYAVSMEHAATFIRDMKETVRLTEQVVG